MKINKIEIYAKEWTDKVHGNSYFAGKVFINDQFFGFFPFQYGYEQQYIEAGKQLINNIIPNVSSLTRYCRENNVELYTTKKINCKKKDLKEFTTHTKTI